MRVCGIWILGIYGLMKTLYAQPLCMTEQEVRDGLVYDVNSCTIARYPLLLEDSEEVLFQKPPPIPSSSQGTKSSLPSHDKPTYLTPPLFEFATGVSEILSQLSPKRKSETPEFCSFKTSCTLFYLDSKNDMHSRQVSNIRPDRSQYATFINAAESGLHFVEPWRYHGFNATTKEIHWTGRGIEGKWEDFFTPFPHDAQIFPIPMLACSYSSARMMAPIVFPFDSPFQREKQWSSLEWSLYGPHVTFPHMIQIFYLLFLNTENKSGLYATPSLAQEEMLSWASTCAVKTISIGEVTRIPCQTPTSWNMKEIMRSMLGGSIGAGIAGLAGGMTAGVVGAATGVLVSKQIQPSVHPGITPEKHAQELYLAQALQAWKAAKRPVDQNANTIILKYLKEEQLSCSSDEEIQEAVRLY